MKKNHKRIWAILLTLIMVVSMCPVSVFAADEGIVFAVDTSAYTSGVEIGTNIEVPVKVTSNVGFAGASLKAVYDSTYLTLNEAVSGDMGFTVTNSGDNLTIYTTSDIATTGTLVVLKFTVNENAAGKEVSISVTGRYGEAEDVVKADKTTTVSYSVISGSVTVKSVASDPYEIYYTLNDVDSDNDKYNEYDIGDTITATVYIKNNTGTAVSLQAYDIYLTHDSKLTLNSYAANDSKGKLVTENGTHIQAIGENTTTADININLPADGTAVPLGTLAFAIKSDAIYGEGLEIALTSGSETQGKNSTNISVGNATIGDTTSYYPQAIGDVLGAEVMTTYTVTYDANEGTGAPANQNKEYNNPLTLSSTVPTRTGWTFTGWSGSDGTTYQPGDTYNTNAALTLTAQWQQDTVAITWLNGDGSTFTTTNVNYGTAPTAPSTNPTKAETAQYTYEFAGWAATEGGEKIEIFPNATAATTYYPLFSPTLRSYTVTFMSQDGTKTLGIETVNYGEKPTYSTVPTKEDTVAIDYEFAGWATTANQTSGTMVADLPVVEGPVTYYAAFSETAQSYTVTYNAGGHGSFAADAVTKESVLYNGNPVNAPAVIEATGYIFTGWSDCTTTSKNLSDFTVTDNVILTAQYAPISYTVKFELDGGVGTVPGNITATYDADVTMPSGEGLTKEGYIFAGWSLNKEEPDPDKIYGAGTSVKNLASTGGATVTLYAQWSAADFTVSVQNPTDGSGTVTASPTTANMGTKVTVTAVPAAGYEVGTVTYTKEGEITTNDIYATDGVYSFEMPAANVTVTATFDKVNLAVTVDDNIVGGEVESDKATAKINETVTLSADLADGYELGGYTVTYTDDQNNEQTVNVNADGTFTMPGYPVTVTATFNAKKYTITYTEDGGSEIADGEYTVETDTFTLPTNTTKIGYTFAGWQDAEGNAVTKIVKGTTGNIVLTAQWTPNTNTPYTVKHWQQNVGVEDTAEQNATNYTLKDTDNLTGTTAAEVTPDVKDYEGFKAPNTQKVTILADGSLVVNYYYTRETINVTFKDGEKVLETVAGQYGADLTAPNAPTKDGYEFVEWKDIPSTIPSTDTEITADWRAITYTITFNVNGGNDLTGEGYVTTNKMEYTIESEGSLPKPTHSNPLYDFKYWTASDVEGSWTATDYNAGTALKDKYGNVTLTAQWDTNFTYKVEEYKYADSGYVMLRIATDSNANAYTFNGEKMFYTDDTNYKLTVKVNDQDVQKSVFVTLIPMEGNVDANMTLTAAAIAKLAQDSEQATAVSRDGKINDDSIVNIADANIVYQMIVNGGGYYGNQLLTDKRLGADMITDAAVSSEHRATIADVNAIVNIINGTTTTN